MSELKNAGTSRARPTRGSNESRACRLETSVGLFWNTASLSATASRTVESEYVQGSAATATPKQAGTVTLGDAFTAFAARATFISTMPGVSDESGHDGMSTRAGVVA